MSDRLDEAMELAQRALATPPAPWQCPGRSATDPCWCACHNVTPAHTEDACGSCGTPGHFAGDGTHDCGRPAPITEAHTGSDAPPHRMAVPDGD